MGWFDSETVAFETLKGKTFKSVVRTTDILITFTTTDNVDFIMQHDQDCCETVEIESVVGDLQDLVGEPILVAEEVTNRELPPKGEDFDPYGSHTWTFYKLATRKGYVDIRWYGESNGYYSERVTLTKSIETEEE
jgi:hypothetical protein